MQERDRPAGEHADGELPLMLDAAEAATDDFPSELDRQQRISSDPSAPLHLRLDAVEDIVDSEVGDTDLIRARNLERRLGFRQIFVKFEGGNPSGTQKDRIAFAQVTDALRRGFDAITLATCGNYGVATARAARVAGLRAVVHVPSDYHSRRLAEIRAAGGEIVLVPGDYEGAVLASRALAAREQLYDANPGGENSLLQLKAYGEIAHEIYDELRDAPAAVAVPVSNGTTLAGIQRGFSSLLRRGRTSRMPRLVAGSSFRKNPIVEAHRKGLLSCADLPPQRIRQTAINEPLINWHSIDGDLALAALRGCAGLALDASDRSLTAAARLLREEQGLSVLPASTAGLVAMIEAHRKSPWPGDRYVVVVTGRRS
jgi:threonine synthase